MGTIADKLQAVLNSKNAIKSKFNLSDELPFSQYADNINIHVDASGGIDFSFITAEANDILEGKVSVDKDGKQITGVLKPGTDVSATTATAPDVLEGKQFYNAQGVLTQGTLVPQSGGSTMDFYKCAAVAGKAKEPIPEPIFAEKFNGTLSNDFTQLASAPEYNTIDGRLAMKCDYDHRLSTSCGGFPSGNAPRTMSAWIYCNSGSLSGTWNMFCIYGSDDGFGMRAYNGELYADGTAWQPYETIGDLSENAWQHIVLVGEGDKTVGYINGVKSGEVTYELSTTLTGGLQIGYLYGRTDAYSTDAYISDLQIYDVALSAEQVTKLYKSSTGFPEPVFAEKFNGALSNDFTQLASAPEYSTIDGRLAMKCDYDHRLSAPCDGFPSGNAPRTMSAWIYCNEGSLSGEWSMLCSYGSLFGLAVYEGDLLVRGSGYPYNPMSAVAENQWQHLVATVEGDKVIGYINGAKIGEVTYIIDTVNMEDGLCIGFEIGDPRPFSTDAYISDLQIYDTALTAEQVEELYKKSQDTSSNGASVNSTDIVVGGISAANYEQANGEYYLYSGEGAGRIWISKHTFSHSGQQQCYGKIYQYLQNGTWRLVIVNNPDADSYFGKVAVLNGSTHPDPIGTWDFWDYSGSPVVTAWKTAEEPEEPEAPLAPNTWNGYKAVLVTDDEGNKYYEFSETLTKGLTYGNGFTPVVDKVYDSEAMIMATLSEKNKYPEIASPMDMTGYTKDDWVVSESDYRFASTKAWNGFYPNGIWAGDDWLQWQNTAQQVLVRQLTFGYGGNSNWAYKCRLDGSDDGEHWTEIGTRDCEYDSDNNTILTFPDNNTAYYYHRLVVVSSNGCAVVYNLLAKRDIDGRNTP